MKNLFFLFLFSIFTLSAYSQGNVIWDFEGNTTSGTVSSGAGVTANDAVFGPGLNDISYVAGNGGGTGYKANLWTSNSSPDYDDYIEVSITAGNVGKVISGFSFDEKSEWNSYYKGPQKYVVKYSIDNGTSTQLGLEGSTNGNWASHSYTTNIALSAGSTLYFKIYGYESKSFFSLEGSWTFDNIEITISGTLKINVLDFNAKKNQSVVDIFWITSTEINSDYFSLEWSRDGKNFGEIAKINSKRDNRDLQIYRYSHTDPSPGINFYRLTQYDLDGRRETFSVVSVSFDLQKKFMSIVPNRVVNNLRVEFNQPADNGRLLIYNMAGRLVKSGMLNKDMIVIDLDVSGLLPGQYIVKYMNATGTITKRFIKL